MNKEDQIRELYEQIKFCTGAYDDDSRSCADIIYEYMGYRKQSEGEWQTAPDGTHWCSECGHDATYTFDGTEICGVACPFCGAKMKGGAK